MTLSSNKVRTFGMEGKKEGQFFDPAGLVTDDMGNLIVNDAGNDRLQVSVLMQENVTNSFIHLSKGAFTNDVSTLWGEGVVHEMLTILNKIVTSFVKAPLCITLNHYRYIIHPLNSLEF